MNSGRKRNVRRRARWAGTLGVGLALAWGGVALAKSGETAGANAASGSSTSKPVLITADDLVYDQDTGAVTARGHVEIAQEDRVLLADQVNYSEKTQDVIAAGNVTLLEPDGTVLFSDYMKLKDDLKAGVVNSIRVLLSDNSRMAGRQGVRAPDNKTTLDRAVYSPCHLCEEDPTRAPLWQIKSYKVVHDQEAKQISYEDAFLEFYGVPVAYTPYFSHPDPSVKRKSGFLAPSIGSSSELGTRIALPYYWAISPERDLTVTPIITTEQGLVMLGNYRALTDTGNYNIEMSGTYADMYDSDTQSLSRQGWRGHVFAQGRFDLSSNTRWGFQLRRASDETYLRRYRFEDASRLRSQIYTETFMGDSYFSVNAYSFQTLREREGALSTPLILPWMTYNFVAPTDRLGGRFTLDANALVLQRESELSSRRLSLKSEWRRPFYSRFGEVYTLSLGLRADGYSSENNFDSAGREVQPISGRVVPEATLEWRLPFVRSWGSLRQTVEPIGSVTVAPYGGNPDRIPNEDSPTVEFDDSSLLSSDRFPGLDRVESGPRAMAGARTGFYADNGGAATVTVGQVFRLKPDTQFASSSGLAGTQSDYVGRIDLLPNSFIDLSHRFRLRESDLSLAQNEVRAIFGPEQLKFDIGYIDVAGDPSDPGLPQRTELYTAARAAISENWSIKGSMRRDLTEGGGLLGTGAMLSYIDECIETDFVFTQRFTTDRDIKPSTSFNVVVRLLNLGS